MLPPRLNGEMYLSTFFTKYFDFLEDLLLALLSGMWFLHDGALALSTRLDVQHPYRTFEKR